MQNTIQVITPCELRQSDLQATHVCVLSDFVSPFKEWHLWRKERALLTQVSAINLRRGISEFDVTQKYCNKTNTEEKREIFKWEFLSQYSLKCTLYIIIFLLQGGHKIRLLLALQGELMHVLIWRQILCSPSKHDISDEMSALLTKFQAYTFDMEYLSMSPRKNIAIKRLRKRIETISCLLSDSILQVWRPIILLIIAQITQC